MTIWQQIDGNPHTADIVADGGNLYQRWAGYAGNWGIWKYTFPLNPQSPWPGWVQLDDAPSAGVAAADGGLYQRRTDHKILTYRSPDQEPHHPFDRYWLLADENSRTSRIAAGNMASIRHLYQLWDDGEIWSYTFPGIPFPPPAGHAPFWIRLDGSHAVEIAADQYDLYQRRPSGEILRYRGVPGSWETLGTFGTTRQITADGGHLYRRGSDGSIWRHTGSDPWEWLPTIADGSSPIDIVADGEDLHQLRANGDVHTYVALTGTWVQRDDSSATKQIAASGGSLYQRRSDGSVYQLLKDE